jgi:hypothetical protein
MRRLNIATNKTGSKTQRTSQNILMISQDKTAQISQRICFRNHQIACNVSSLLRQSTCQFKIHARQSRGRRMRILRSSSYAIGNANRACSPKRWVPLPQLRRPALIALSTVIAIVQSHAATPTLCPQRLRCRSAADGCHYHCSGMVDQLHSMGMAYKIDCSKTCDLVASKPCASRSGHLPSWVISTTMTKGEN